MKCLLLLLKIHLLKIAFETKAQIEFDKSDKFFEQPEEELAGLMRKHH